MNTAATILTLAWTIAPTDLFLPAGLLLIIVSMFSVMRKRHRRLAQQGRLTPREIIERNRQQTGAHHDLNTLMVEVEQLAKRFSSQLDAKSIELDVLLRRADDRIAELKRFEASPPNPAELPLVPDDPLAASVYQLADQGLPADQIAGKLDEHVGKVELILALRNV